MAREIEDWYQVLELANDADTADIEKALEQYDQKQRGKLNNPLTAKGAIDVVNRQIPDIKRVLLSGPTARKNYDQQLSIAKQKQAQSSASYDSPQNLDEYFRRCFFFDRDQYDTEQGAFTLRELSLKLDHEWARARSWLRENKPGKKHPLIPFLKHSALCEELSTSIDEQIISQLDKIPIDEALERCLFLLNPELERPMFAINDVAITKDTQGSLSLGAFIPDRLIECDLSFSHTGPRGCVFGSIESRSPWLRLPQSQIRFALLPEAHASDAAPALWKLPLHLDLSSMPRQTIQSGKLLISLKNYDPPLAIPVQLSLKVLTVPPRIFFEPVASRENPLFVGRVRRGAQIDVTLVPRNHGDETLIPLVASVSSRSPDVLLSSQVLRTNQPFALAIKTHDKPQNKPFFIALDINYHATQGAEGPEKLYLWGSVLPTVWQSILQETSFPIRLLHGVLGAGTGVFIAYMAFLFVHTAFLLWLCLLPALLLFLTWLAAATLWVHRQKAGYTPAKWKYLPHPLLWLALPLVGVLITLLDEFSYTTLTPFLLGSLFIGVSGCVAGFLGDWRANTQRKSEEKPMIQRI